MTQPAEGYAMALEVDLADLAASAADVTAHGEDLAARHFAAARRIDDADSGWRGQSAAALAVTVEHWAASTSTLLSRLGDHAAALSASVAAFGGYQQRSASALDSLH